ncbi:MAG: hypothetical protein ACKVPJ_00430 [Chitinophagales bacterium]
MFTVTQTLSDLSKFRKYLLITAIIVLAAVEVIVSGFSDINVFSTSINVWQLLILVCLAIIIYILFSYYLESKKNPEKSFEEPLVLMESIKEEKPPEDLKKEMQSGTETPLEKETFSQHNQPVEEHLNGKSSEKTVNTLVHGFTNELKLNNEQAEADVLKYFIEKIEKITDEFSIVIYGSGNRQLYMGIDAITIHLDRIANFYNDHDQFKGELTRYDAQLFHMIEFSDTTIRRIEYFRPENTYLKEQLTELLKLVYVNKLTTIFEKYENMFARVENKKAKQILESVMDKITETKFSMEMLEKSVY